MDAQTNPKIPLPSGADVINKLPNEVLLKIFEYLDSRFIVKKISKVCQRFKGLSKTQSLLKRMVFCKKDCSDEAMVDALEHSKNLIKIRFMYCAEPYITNLVKIALAQCPKIASIDITRLLRKNSKVMFSKKILPERWKVNYETYRKRKNFQKRNGKFKSFPIILQKWHFSKESN